MDISTPTPTTSANGSNGLALSLMEFPRLGYDKTNIRISCLASAGLVPCKRVKNRTKSTTEYFIPLTNPSHSDWPSDAQTNIYQSSPLPCCPYCTISTISSVMHNSHKKSPHFESLEFKRKFIGHLGQQIFWICELMVEMVQYLPPSPPLPFHHSTP
jgi:hypothetical protein